MREPCSCDVDSSKWAICMPSVLNTNFVVQGDICKFVNCGDSQTCYFYMLKRTAHVDVHLVERYLMSAAKTLVVLCYYPVDNLYAHPGILYLLPDNLKHDVGTATIRIRMGRR